MSAVIRAVGAHAAADSRRVALTSGASVLTYADLARAISGTANALGRHLRTSDAVALQVDNGLSAVVADLSLVKLGVACVPIPKFFTDQQFSGAIRNSGATWMLSDTEFGEPVEVAGERLWLRRTDAQPISLPDQTAKISYTSGSTGAPKGVCLSQAHMERVATSIVARFGSEFAGVHTPILPLSVLLENVAGLYSVLLAGGQYNIEKPAALGCANPFKPDFAALGEALKRARTTSLIVVPELLRGLMAARAFSGVEMPSLNLVAVGGAKVAPDLLQTAHSLGIPAFEGYGLTECASVVAVNAPNSVRSGAVGKPLDHVAITIASDGEICVGPSGFLGYAGHAPHEGPVRTGDVGYRDDDGFLYVTGRKSNLIITSFGRNVSPEWVESELLAEPTIRHALVFGEGRPALRALIAPIFPNIAREQVAASVERANARLPEYARIADFSLLAPLSADRGELTGNGRVRRAALLAAHADFVNA